MYLVNKENLKDIIIVDTISILQETKYLLVKEFKYAALPLGWEKYFEYNESDINLMTCEIVQGIPTITFQFYTKYEFVDFKKIIKEKIFDYFEKQAALVKSKWPESEEGTWAYKLDEVREWKALTEDQKLEAIKDKDDKRFACLFWESHPVDTLTKDSIFIIDNLANGIESNIFKYKKYMSILIGKKNALLNALMYTFDFEDLYKFNYKAEVTIEDFNQPGMF